MLNKTLLSTRPVYKTFARSCWQKPGVDSLSWKSHHMKHMVGVNVALFAGAIYYNMNINYGDAMLVPKERDGKLICQ